MSVVERISVLARDMVKLRDGAELRFGDGSQGADPDVSDLSIAWDGTDFDIVPAADDSILKIGTGTYSFDVWLYGQSSAYYLFWDASTSTLRGSGGVSVVLEDSNYLKFGNSNDVTLTWDATNLVMAAAANNSVFEIGDAAATQLSFDVKVYGAASDGYLLWDASADTLYLSGGENLALMDNDTLKFGASSDVTVKWDATNLVMAAAADDSVFEIGDAASTQLSFDVKVYGNASDGYMLWDASADTLYLSGGETLALMDNDTLKFGAGGDVSITWDATNLVITAAADDSVIEFGDANATQASFDVRFYGNTTSGGSFLQWDASADVLIQSGGGVIDNKNATFTSGTIVAAVPFMAGNTLGYFPLYSTL